MSLYQQAIMLPIKELWRHAKVSLDNRHYCKDCFCCACVDALKAHGEIRRTTRELNNLNKIP